MTRPTRDFLFPKKCVTYISNYLFTPFHLKQKEL